MMNPLPLLKLRLRNPPPNGGRHAIGTTFTCTAQGIVFLILELTNGSFQNHPNSFRDSPNSIRCRSLRIQVTSYQSHFLRQMSDHGLTLAEVAGLHYFLSCGHRH